MPLETGLPPGRRIFAVGDSHGKSRQLRAMLDSLEESLQGDEDSLLVFLGDLVDRGEDSLGCIDAAMEASDRDFGSVVHLMGNHEQMLQLTIRGDQGALDLYRMNGGGTLMDQLGMHKWWIGGRKAIGQALASALGAGRASFLNRLRSHYSEASLLFVHAGTNPYNSLEAHLGQPWDSLTDYHWSWIRFPFLQMPVHIPGLTVVHGHTPARLSPPAGSVSLDPHYVRDGKINIDGGSFRSGCVAAADFFEGRYRVHVTC